MCTFPIKIYSAWAPALYLLIRDFYHQFITETLAFIIENTHLNLIMFKKCHAQKLFE